MSTLHDRLLLLESKIDSMRGLYNLPPSFPSTPPPGDRRTFKQTATNVQVSFTDKSKITKSVEITTTQYQGSLLFFGSFFFFFFGFAPSFFPSSVFTSKNIHSSLVLRSPQLFCVLCCNNLQTFIWFEKKKVKRSSVFLVPFRVPVLFFVLFFPHPHLPPSPQLSRCGWKPSLTH
jgi:hypothetical protein